MCESCGRSGFRSFAVGASLWWGGSGSELTGSSSCFTGLWPSWPAPLGGTQDPTWSGGLLLSGGRVLFLPPWACCRRPPVLLASWAESVRSLSGGLRETLWGPGFPLWGLPPPLAVLPSLPPASPAGEVAGCPLVLLPRLLVAPGGLVVLLSWCRAPTFPPIAMITVSSDTAGSPSCESKAWSPQWGPGTLGPEVKMYEWGRDPFKGSD